VFVFDGGAPALKRQTINGRKQRREGRRDDAVRTAGKLLALQMQRRAEEEEHRRKDEVTQPRHIHEAEEEPLPENFVYAEEVQMTPQERQQNRKFKKKDAYHLPELDASFAEMGQPNDPRIMSLEELEQYAKQFHTGEDINVYDFSKIDFDSPFFTSLPASDRYNILNAARLRSRLRMGHSKEQLDAMFPDRMAFSRFQIERVAERNNLTQRLMHINSGNDDLGFGVNAVSRIAGERGREYVLVKNDGVEGGWALGVVSNEGQQDKPIDVEKLDQPSDIDDESDEDEFEDVPIEGLNRLPRRAQPRSAPVGEIIARDLEKRRALYKSRNGKAPQRRKPRTQDDPDSLFVAASDEEDWEDVTLATGTRNTTNPAIPADEDEEIRRAIRISKQEGHVSSVADEEEELQRAIAMSMQQNIVPSVTDEDDDYAEVFEQSKAEEPRPFTKGSGMAIAHMANNRSVKVVPRPFLDDDSDDDMDLRTALEASKKTKHKAPQSSFAGPSLSKPVTQPAKPKSSGFDGPLPFEKLDLGSSILGKKKMQQIAEESAGGFEKESDKPNKKEEAKPLPPWFAGDLDDGLTAQRAVEAEERRRDKELMEDEFIFEAPARLRKHDTNEVIDLEAPEQNQSQEVIAISSDEDSEDDTDMIDAPARDITPKTGHLVGMIRAERPPPVLTDAPSALDEAVPLQPRANAIEVETQSDDEPLEWEASGDEAQAEKFQPIVSIVEPIGGNLQPAPRSPQPESEEEEFEDIQIPAIVPATGGPSPFTAVLEGDEEQSAPIPMSELAIQDHEVDVNIPFEDDIYSDPEDEELFRSLAQEEEEHARFASTLNNRSTLDNAAEYERELKQLRNQQKKDRRDADEVTHTMITECQQLLSLFGLPYITAPMEAEAQCAELVHLGLVDGIVTDDSDIFLFGGTRVYKNMFNQAKFVECYLTNDLEAEFGLSRDRLIAIAQLLGSDYTDGLSGVGPVTALEILSEFDSLTAFKDWWDEVQTGRRPKQDDASNPFRRKFRKNSAKIFLPMTFPNPRVEEAYLQPEVDSDPSGFVWGVPDLNALREFLMATIGWSPERTDEVLVPVIKDMNRRDAEGTQANITQFFTGGVGAGSFAPRKRAEAGSKRMESALLRIGARARVGAAGQDMAEEVAEPVAKKAAKRKPTQKGKRSKEVAAGEEEEDSKEYAEPRKKVKKNTKKAKGAKTGNAASE
jgi:DNA excision repair protein ERCC-5